jgi:hypothetical protein
MVSFARDDCGGEGTGCASVQKKAQHQKMAIQAFMAGNESRADPADFAYSSHSAQIENFPPRTPFDLGLEVSCS